MWFLNYGSVRQVYRPIGSNQHKLPCLPHTLASICGLLVSGHFVYFTTLAAVRLLQRRMVRWMMNLKGSCLNRCIIPEFACRDWGTPRQDSRCPGRDSSRDPVECGSAALPLCQPARYSWFILFLRDRISIRSRCAVPTRNFAKPKALINKRFL
jgi:hypothetical protein